MPTDPMLPLIDTDRLIKEAADILDDVLNDDTDYPAPRVRGALLNILGARRRMADYTPYRPEHARPGPDATDTAVADLAEALRLTAEYAMLPALAGWSWYDALRRHMPAELEGYPSYKPPAGPPQPVATEREWIGKVRGLIERNVIPSSDAAAHAFGLIMRALDDARDDLAGQPVTAELRVQDSQPAEPDVPDPTIEVLPLAGDRFILVLSGWPWQALPSESDIARMREETGAAHVLITPHYVSLPDGRRSGAVAAATVAASLPARYGIADRLATAAAYARRGTGTGTGTDQL